VTQLEIFHLYLPSFIQSLDEQTSRVDVAKVLATYLAALVSEQSDTEAAVTPMIDHLKTMAEILRGYPVEQRIPLLQDMFVKSDA
jgi:hypothetical protein